jgi:putative alpha-1,2-mannosidase
MLLWLLTAMLCRAQVWQYVDPRIGSEGVGRTFPGPSMPFGMCGSWIYTWSKEGKKINTRSAHQ